MARIEDPSAGATSTDICHENAALHDLHRLRAFVVVSEELNFHRAAVRLNMTQSPLSRVITKLEGEIGVSLFERCRHRVSLTTAGHNLLPQARALLDAATRLYPGLHSQSVANEVPHRRVGHSIVEAPARLSSGARPQRRLEPRYGLNPVACKAHGGGREQRP